MKYEDMIKLIMGNPEMAKSLKIDKKDIAKFASEIKVLEPNLVQGLLDQLTPVETLGAALMPLNGEYKTRKIDFDVIFGDYPVAPFVGLHSPAPVLEQRSKKNKTLTLPRCFFGLTNFDIDMLTDRALGSMEPNELATFNRNIRDAQLIIDKTMEVYRFQALKGSWVYSSSYSSNAFTIDYDFAASHKPANGVTAGYGAIWSNTAAAVPLADIGLVRRVLKQDGGASKIQMWLNAATMANLVANTSILAILGTNTGGTYVPMEARLKQYLAGLNVTLVEYDQVYSNESGVKTQIILDNDVFFIGERPEGVQIGEFASCPNDYSKKSGPFVFPLHTDNPKATQILAGFLGAPLIRYPDNCLYLKTV